MKKLILAAILVILVTTQAFALNAVGFKNYSVSGGAHVPTTCAMVTGSTQADGTFTAASVAIATLATKNSTGTFTVGQADYKFTCRKTNDGAESTVKMYFDSDTSAFFPCSSFLMRNR
jgi:type 1 fimbria pilin